MIIRTSAALAAVLLAGPALGADAGAGKAVFQAQCALCHSAAPNDGGGAQGPSLQGVVGRKAASAAGFSYSKALKASKLGWDAATLDRFLASPTTVVPGSAMVIPIADATDRANVVAYFHALKDGTFKEPPPRAGFVPPPPNPNAPPPKGEQDWKKDQPGRRHRIDLAKLPAPFDTPSAAKFPKLVDRPPGARLKVPAGFKVEVFARDLPGARNMRVAPNGDVFLAQTNSNRITVLRPSADGSKAGKASTFAQGLNLPFGMAFVPADDPRWLYVAEMNRVVRYAYRSGQTVAAGVPEVVVPELYPSKASGHFTRDLAFSLDGRRMYVSVGSESNVAEQIPRKSVAEAQAFESGAMAGAAWGSETNRAAVLVFDAAQPGKPKLHATGIRNCVALTVQPAKGDLWCTTNERDMLGDDLVPDYSTRVKEGQFYGWPWYYMGSHEDPRHAGARPDLAGKVSLPDVPYQAHSASVSLQFYTSTSGRSVFPKEYLGDGFAVLHGSWNREFRTGHKVVRVLMKDGVPTGEYEDFLTGFIVNDGDAWGRPVSNVIAKDGSMLLSDDGANLVYRISTVAPSISIPGDRVFPESLTSAPDGSVYVGSIGARAIFRARPGAAVAEQWIAPGEDAPAGYLGVFADALHGTLWACSLAGPEGGKPVPSTLHAYDLKTGKAKGHYPMPTAGAACNDAAVGADGSIYATDTANMEVVRLAPGAKALEVWVGQGAFGPKGGVLDGIAVLGDRVFVNTLATGKLFGVAIGKDGKAGKVAELKLDRPVDKPDGMRSFGTKELLIVEGGSTGTGRLSRAVIDGDSAVLTTLQEGYPDGAVAVAVVGELAYVVEAQFGAMRGAPGTPTKPFRATAVEVGKPQGR